MAGTTDGIPSNGFMAMPNSVPMVANVIPDQVVTVGTAFRYQFPKDTFDDADGDSLSYRATQGDDSALPL